jgi:hypothetical protein
MKTLGIPEYVHEIHQSLNGVISRAFAYTTHGTLTWQDMHREWDSVETCHPPDKVADNEIHELTSG